MSWEVKMAAEDGRNKQRREVTNNAHKNKDGTKENKS